MADAILHDTQVPTSAQRRRKTSLEVLEAAQANSARYKSSCRIYIMHIFNTTYGEMVGGSGERI
jgi:hypothetical protein